MNKELDTYLLQAIKYQKREWNKPEVGFVSCAIINGPNIVFGTNTINKDGMILHAERNTINKYKKMYGKLDDNSIAVISLSPCIEYSRNRIGTDCASYLLDSNIKRIHFAYLHEIQGTIEKYTELGFIVTQTQIPQLELVSRNLLELYLEGKNNFGNNFEAWTKIKAINNSKVFANI